MMLPPPCPCACAPVAAGEITQGWAAAVRLGATYESFRTTIGIHPTISEEFTTLSISKTSGESAEKGGC